MNEHREHREWRKCVQCIYEQYRQDRVTTHQKVRDGIMPATPDKNPVVLKSEVISPCSSNSSDLIVLLDTPVKTRSRTRVVKTQAQKIREYQEKNKDRITTYKKYNHIRSIKLPATPAELTDNVSELKDLVLELKVH